VGGCAKACVIGARTRIGCDSLLRTGFTLARTWSSAALHILSGAVYWLGPALVLPTERRVWHPPPPHCTDCRVVFLGNDVEVGANDTIDAARGRYGLVDGVKLW